MAFEFKLPDIGEGIHEGEIVKWLVKVGDTVEEDQPLVEVMTDKATVELPSPVAGTILEIRAKEGEVVEVGSVLVVIGAEGEEPKPDGREAERAPTPAKEPVSVAAQAAQTAPPKRNRVLATPATRKLARELGVDITQIEGTGPGGRITDEDVRRFAEGKEVAPALEAEAPERAAPTHRVPTEELEERIPLRGIRKRISDHMHHAVSTAAHFTYVDEVDVTELVKIREELKPVAEERGVKLTYLPFIVKASVAALKKHPYLNASLDHERGEIVLKRYYNIGIATATEQGLLVPVIKGADRLSILEIAREIERLASAAREGKIALEDLQGGTFTITSLGAMGGLLATPIINTPEAAILGVHEIKKRPVVIEGEITIRDIMLIALSFDHRLIDGHVGAAFAKEVKAFLEDPKLLLVGA
jgi:pyruvate dehydrogenase E2 component (dihydrolipoamide acetyltransferase)